MGNYDELTKYIKLLENDSFGERRYEETHYDEDLRQLGQKGIFKAMD